MSERCPLAELQNHWDGEIPDVCRKYCEESWDAAIDHGTPEIDTFTLRCGGEPTYVDESPVLSDECDHDIDHGGMTIKKIDERRRAVGLLSVCSFTGVELFSEMFPFVCKNPN